MAIEYYSSINLNQNELQFPVLHKLTSPPTSPTAQEGQLYYDSSTGEKTVYVYDGSNWINIGQNSITNYTEDTISSGDFLAFSDESQTGDVNNKITVDNYIKTAPALTTEAAIANGDYMLFLDGGSTGEMKKEALADVATLFAGAGMTATNSVLNVISGNGITVNADDVAVTAAQTTITSVLNSSLTVGRDAHNLIDFSTDNAITLRISDANELTFDGTNFFPVTDTGMHLGKNGNAFKSLNLGDNDSDANGALIRFEKTRAGDTVTDNDDIGKFSFFAMNDAGSAEEVEFARWLVEAHDNADGHENARASFKFMAGGALANGIKFTGQSDDTLDVEIGDGASSTVTIPGNLVVTGTTTTNNVETISTSSGVIFEGTTGDGNDATLKSVVANSSKTYTLPNVTGHVALFAADPSTTAISSTPSELNLLDAATSGSSVTLATGDSLIIGDASDSNTSKKVLMSDVLALFSSNLTSVGALVEGSIAPGFGAIDNSGNGGNVGVGAATIKTDTLTATVGIIPDASDGAALGSDSREWSDLYLADGAQILFGDDQEIRITHNHNKGLTFSHEATGDTTPFILTLESEEDDVRNGDVISGIEFKSGDSSGGDAVLPAVGIFAVAADTFDTTINRSKLVFSVASTESAGLTSGTIDFTADMTLDVSGNLTIPGELDAATGDFSGAVDIAGDLTLSAGGDGALIFGTAGQNSIKIPDNQASALIIEEANNAYMTFKTTNSSELITANKPFNINSTFQLGGTSVTASAAEINLIDGGTARTTNAPVDGDGILHNNGGTMEMTKVETFATYFAAEISSQRMVVADIDVSELIDSKIVTITHNLGTADVIVQVYDKTTEANVMCDIARTTDDFSTADTDNISIDFGTAPPHDCRVLITSLANAATGTVAYT